MSTKAGIKVASIGQAMMQATRPRVLLAPLQLGLGVQLYTITSHHDSLLTPFIIMGFAVPTKKFSGLSIMLLSRMELTFPT